MQCYKGRKVDPKDVTKHCLNVADKYKHLNYFVSLNSDAAEERAQQSSERWQNGNALGDLDGVPIAIKDNFCVKGMRTTCASRFVLQLRLFI